MLLFQRYITRRVGGGPGASAYGIESAAFLFSPLSFPSLVSPVVFVHPVVAVRSSPHDDADMLKRERSTSSSSSHASSSERRKNLKREAKRKSRARRHEKSLDQLAEEAKALRELREKEIEAFLARKANDGENSDSQSDDLDDRWVGERSATPTNTESEVSSESSESSGEDIQTRLLSHAQATTRSTVATKMPSIMNVAKKPSKLKPSAVSAALENLKEELTKPVEESTALTVVDASEEAAEMVIRQMASKIPPPPPGDSAKLRRLQYVDHSTVNYIPIRTDFYVIPPDVKALTTGEMKQLLRELDGAKIRGTNPPRPMRTWDGSGIPDKVLDVLEKHEFKFPFAVQSIGAPCLMSGRDLLVAAKTGSGKTLAYVLPMIRHCIDQPRCKPGEGPIGLVLVPTQELAVQVHALLTELCEAAGIRAVASYGSTPLSDNIRAAKAGCEVMTCTPGRLLDLLTVNGGNTVSLRRTSFAVLDEADRLFDSGFMEHVVAFLKNIRPDRQVAMISATLPKELKREVMQHMRNPLEISVGGRPTPASNVEQLFYFFDEEIYEVDSTQRKESSRFVKLMQILGDEGGNGEHLILVFVQRKEEVEEIMAKLTVLGYRNRVATLYSGMDPVDREFALEHFSPGNQFILVATAVAERGLDIPFLELVINYSLPNHFEAYVHRIGRTGRAGRKGRAVNFFTRGKDDDIAPELVEGLERAEQQVPEELYEIATKVRELRKEGGANHRANFYRGYLRAKRQRFTDRDQKEQVRAAAKAAGLAEFLSGSSESDSDADSNVGEPEIVPFSGVSAPTESSSLTIYNGSRNSSALVLSSAQEDRVSKALAFAQKTTAVLTEDGADQRFSTEYPINDLPDVVRGRLQSRRFLDSVMEETNVSIVKKGIYFEPRYRKSKPKDGEVPLYLLIIGKTTEDVQAARRKLNEMREEVMSRQRTKLSSIGAVL